MTVKLSISLTDQQAAYARKQVEEGRFSSTSAVIQQALEAKRQEDEAYQRELEAFRAMIEERKKGPFLSAEDFGEKIDQMLQKKRAQYGVED